MGEDPRNILAIAPAWIGDFVMAQSLYKALRQTGVPNIDILAPRALCPIATRMPEIRTAPARVKANSEKRIPTSPPTNAMGA